MGACFNKKTTQNVFFSHIKIVIKMVQKNEQFIVSFFTLIIEKNYVNKMVATI